MLLKMPSSGAAAIIATSFVYVQADTLPWPNPEGASEDHHTTSTDYVCGSDSCADPPCEIQCNLPAGFYRRIQGVSKYLFQSRTFIDGIGNC